jgi:tRNA(His) 5'-end guanylyltransferase
MAAQAHFSHRRLEGVSTGGMQELLWSEVRVNWNDYSDGCKRGRVTVRRTGERPVEYVDKRTQQPVSTTAVRSWWETSPPPTFTTTPDEWLARTIPALPTLGALLH